MTWLLMFLGFLAAALVLVCSLAALIVAGKSDAEIGRMKSELWEVGLYIVDGTEPRRTPAQPLRRLSDDYTAAACVIADDDYALRNERGTK